MDSETKNPASAGFFIGRTPRLTTPIEVIVVGCEVFTLRLFDLNDAMAGE